MTASTQGGPALLVTLSTPSIVNIKSESTIQVLDAGLPGEVVPNSHWQVNHVPVANTQATITVGAAGVGKRNVCNYLSFTLSTDIIAPAVFNTIIEVLDNVTRIWGARMVARAVAGSLDTVAPAIILVGSVNVDMVIRFAAAAGVNTFETISAQGYVIG